MKTLVVVCYACLLVTLVSTLAVGQNGFEIVPFPKENPADVQIIEPYAFTKGYWAPVDKQDKHSQLAGPSVSDISCDHQEMICHEAQANIVVMGNMFTMTADSVDYKIERWNSKEIVAKYVGGICRTLNVLKFDLVQKRVYAFQTLSEPTNDLPKMSQELCAAAKMNLELKESSMWMKP